MKYLPEKFPIRYAIIVSDWLDKDMEEDKPQLYTSAKSEMLFRQLLLLLQKEALNEKSLTPTAETIKFTLMDVEIINISKLNAPFDWATNLRDEIIRIIPEAKHSSRSTGVAFEVGLYSYKGAGEKPSFLMAHNILAKHDNYMQGLPEIIHKFGYLENSSDIKCLYNDYEKIKDNKITNFQLYESMAKYAKPVYISTPYSKTWKILDSGFQDGIIPVFGRSHKEDIIEKSELLDEKDGYSKSKILVAVCRNWEELFAEEISALYKMFNFCNNCGRALPFDYKGNYCPDLSENKNCIKERNRKRKSQKKN